jgi:phytoene dehydrogenase-like protein
VASYDAIIVGGGHNGLVAAAYLARAGRRVLVLERLAGTGGAAVSEQPFAGVGARLSRYAYLVSLFPHEIASDLGLDIELRRRAVSSYTPTVRDGRDTGLLVTRDPHGTERSFRALTGDARAFAQWMELYGLSAAVAERLAPTLLGPVPTRVQAEALLADIPGAWERIVEAPLGRWVEETVDDDLVRGIVLTDALIGTFADAHDSSLAQNRCFLYHVIGNGTGDWDVPVGGMGALTDALAETARAAGAEIVTGAEVITVWPGPDTVEVTWRHADGESTASAAHALANVAPSTLAHLLGEEPPTPAPEGAQLKINLLVTRLPRLKSGHSPEQAFAGTFHVAEGYEELATAYREAAAGTLPSAPPSELYCHTLTDPSILDGELRAKGYQTLTLFGLHTPARLFRDDPAQTTAELVRRTIATFETYLAEPLDDVLARDTNGRPCLEAKNPLDLEATLGLPGGNIFHRDLQWPWAEPDDPAGPWGVETHHPRVLLCGSGARRGGAVSGIPGRSAAMRLLGVER